MAKQLAAHRCPPLHAWTQPHAQGFPEGYTEACYPIASSSISGHRRASVRESDTEARERARFAVLGNAVSVEVCPIVRHVCAVRVCVCVCTCLCVCVCVCIVCLCVHVRIGVYLCVLSPPLFASS